MRNPGLAGSGRDGMGGSSYIDSMVLRDRDANTAWTTQSDGTLEERVYYCQNWRGDVSVLLTDAGTMLEWVKYLAYGRQYGHPGGDVDGNGSTNVDDATALINLMAIPGYHIRADVDLDGDVDTDDIGYFSSGTMGWGVLSMVGNRFGYAGYHHASELAGTKWDVRNRWLDSVTGVWNRRDPLGYVDGMNLYQYARGMALVAVDPVGLAIASATCGTTSVDYCGGPSQPVVPAPELPTPTLPSCYAPHACRIYFPEEQACRNCCFNSLPCGPDPNETQPGPWWQQDCVEACKPPPVQPPQPGEPIPAETRFKNCMQDQGCAGENQWTTPDCCKAGCTCKGRVYRWLQARIIVCEACCQTNNPGPHCWLLQPTGIPIPSGSQ